MRRDSGRWPASLASALCLTLLGAKCRAASKSQQRGRATGVRPLSADFLLAPVGHPVRPNRWSIRPLSVESHFSVDGPYGVFGIGIDVAPSPSFSLATGLGFARSTGAPQAGVVGRVRLPLAPGVGGGAEAGFSGGRYVTAEGCDGGSPDLCPVWQWRTAVWGVVGLFVEARSPDGFELRAGAGARSIFNRVDGTCSHCAVASEPSFSTTTTGYLDFAVGYALSL